jgi:hypothetical protein
MYSAGPPDVANRAKPRTLLYFESITPITASTALVISFMAVGIYELLNFNASDHISLNIESAWPGSSFMFSKMSLRVMIS